MTYWLRQDYRKSLDTLLHNPEMRENNGTELAYNEMASMGHPDIFNFYMYLRSHPYVRRCHLSQHTSKPMKNRGIIKKLEPNKHGSTDPSTTDAAIFAPNERELVYRTAHTHLNSGMPSVALEVLLLLPKNISGEKIEEGKLKVEDDINDTAQDSKTEDMIVSGTISDGLGFSERPQCNGATKVEDIDWSKPVSSKAEDFDWSKPVSSKAEDIDWSKPVSSKTEDFDWSKPVSSKTEDFDWSKPVSSKVEDFDWSKPVSSKAEDFDWSKPVSSKTEDFDWSKPVSSKAEDFDWSKPVSSKTEDFDWKNPVVSDIQSSQDSNFTEEDAKRNVTSNGLTEDSIDGLIDSKNDDVGNPDVASLHVKYISVFKCLIEELRSLPSTCTLEGVKLRPTVAHLLERELEALHKLCDYGFQEGDDDDNNSAVNEALQDPILRRDSDCTCFMFISVFELSSKVKA